jgi:RNA polymerase sigma-70 factor (ECF subfamily)
LLNGPLPAEPGDAALLRLARSGDRQALETLCRRYWRPVYRSLARYTSDPGEAEDLTQEVFLRALRALPGYTDRGLPYLAYLLRIAANLARDWWRAGPARVVPVASFPDRPAPGPGPDGLAVASDRRAALLRALDRIAPDHRTVLRLRILEGRTAIEVGAMTGRSPAAVRQLSVRALTALRAVLAEQPDTRLDERLGAMTADPGRE